jgi:pimeloyl-ACP methyl ester carboxylesterase
MKKTLTYPDGEMHYRIFGNGQPLLLLHGFGESGTIWDLQSQALSEHALILIPDLPGTGKSLTPASGPYNSLDEYAALINTLLDNERIERCTLVGHSMGGYIALAFAEMFPDRLDGFGLFHSTALPDSPQRIEARNKGIRLIKEYGAAPFLAEIIPGLYSESFRQTHHAAVKEHVEESAKWATKEALTGYYEAMMSRPDRRKVLAQFPRPICMILGTHDKTVDLEETKPQTELLQQGFINIMDSVAHMGMRESSEASLDILVSFLQKIKQT